MMDPQLLQLFYFFVINYFFNLDFLAKSQHEAPEMLKPSLPVFIICESKYANKVKTMCIQSAG